MGWMLNPVSGEPMKLTKAQADDIQRNKQVSPTSEVLSSLTKIAGSTGGSLLILLALLPLVLKQLTSQIPQLAGILAVISQAIKDPEKTAGEFGEDMANTILALPKGFFSGIVSEGFDIGQLVTGGPQPYTSNEAAEAAGIPQPTQCDRFNMDLVEIKKQLDSASGLRKIQGTLAWTTKLFDMKSSGCSRPGFVSQDTWDRVPG